MSKKLTQADRMGFRMSFSMYRVMELLDWDVLTYCMFKYECGLIYLKAYLQGDIDAIDQLQRMASFWGWWKLHWYLREEDFLKEQWLLAANAEPGGLVKGKFHLRAWFKDKNNPMILARALTPAGVILEDSYCKDLIPMFNGK